MRLNPRFHLNRARPLLRPAVRTLQPVKGRFAPIRPTAVSSWPARLARESLANFSRKLHTDLGLRHAASASDDLGDCPTVEEAPFRRTRFLTGRSKFLKSHP